MKTEEKVREIVSRSVNAENAFDNIMTLAKEIAESARVEAYENIIEIVKKKGDVYSGSGYIISVLENHLTAPRSEDKN